MLQKRSVTSVVIFSLLTFGIYLMWWFYVTARDLQYQGGFADLSPSFLLITYLFFSPLGGGLFAINARENILRIRYMRALTPRPIEKTLWILLGAIIPLVAAGVIQSEINKLFDEPPTYRGYQHFYSSYI